MIMYLLMQIIEANRHKVDLVTQKNTATGREAKRDVVVGVLLRTDGTFLLARRPVGKVWEGYWEFPGGKIEQGEPPMSALARELREELGIQVQRVYPWIRRGYLHFYRVTRWQGEPQPMENQELSWQEPGNLNVMPLIPANYPILQALTLPPVCALTNMAELGVNKFFCALEKALEQGLQLLQIREKSLSPKELGYFCERVLHLTENYKTKVMLNSAHGDDYLVKAWGLDGLHLTSYHLMRYRQRPDVKLCSASCHSQSELIKSESLGLDFTFLSPVKTTASHPESETLGWARFREWVMNSKLPVYALGGMHPNDVETAWINGAQGIATQRAYWLDFLDNA